MGWTKVGTQRALFRVGTVRVVSSYKGARRHHPHRSVVSRVADALVWFGLVFFVAIIVVSMLV